MSSIVQLCLILCDPMDYSPPGSSVRGVLQAGILERVAIFSSTSSPPPLLDPGIKLKSLMPPALAGGFFNTSTTWKAPLAQALILNLIKCLLFPVVLVQNVGKS